MDQDTLLEEPTITAHGYLASPITDNIREMEDGTLVIENCPIARDGWQTYSVRDLPQQTARELGIDLSNPSASIDLYRPAEEVFAPEFIASLEGRPITDNHPPDFITPDTFARYAMGHLQNVRRGDEALPSGDWPLLADLVISAQPLIDKVLSKLARENSLGYDYSIARTGDKINQVGMIGNHLAVVPKGRAGDDVRINDGAPKSVVFNEPIAGDAVHPSRAAPPEPAALLPPEPGAGHAASNINVTSTAVKEKPKVKNNLLHIFGLGLRAKAADAETSPEELAEMAADVGKVKDTDPDLYETTMGRDKRGKDKGKGKDAPTVDPVDEDHEPTDDRRKAAHNALDKAMDALDNKKGSKDANIGALRALLDEYLGEEEQEPEHQEPVIEDADPAELEEVLGAGEEPDVEDAVELDPGEKVLESGEESLVGDGVCAHCGTAHDMENCPSCGCKDRKQAMDRARAADGVAATLKMLRPAVARCKDEGMKVAFNTALRTLRKSRVRDSRPSYGSFAAGARARDNKVGTDPRPLARAAARDGAEKTRDQKMQEYYDKASTGGK